MMHKTFLASAGLVSLVLANPFPANYDWLTYGLSSTNPSQSVPTIGAKLHDDDFSSSASTATGYPSAASSDVAWSSQSSSSTDSSPTSASTYASASASASSASGSWSASGTSSPSPSSTASTNTTAHLHPNLTGNNQTLISALSLAATAVDRYSLLSDPEFVYSFTQPPSNATTTGLGGHTVKADRKTFPALIHTGVSMTVGFLGPCGFNTPHVHPRSSEINIVVQGRLGTQFAAENGARVVTNVLGQYDMTVFPMGATHTEFNPDCEDAVFVAGFADEDPGVEQLAQTLFELEGDLVKATLGGTKFAGVDVDQVKAMLPANVALGVEECLAKCGLKKSVADYVSRGLA